MQLYIFFQYALAWSLTVAALWPVTIPWANLTYRIRNGSRELPIDDSELWTRAVIGSLALAGLTLGFVVIDYVIADMLDIFPAGIVHMVVFLSYLPTATWISALMFAYDDLLEGLGFTMIYLYMPTLVLFVVNAIFGLWNPLLNLALALLKTPT